MTHDHRSCRVGGVLLFLLKVLGILLLVVLALMVLLLLIPFCADVSWEQDTLTVKAGHWASPSRCSSTRSRSPTEESKVKSKRQAEKGKSGKEALPPREKSPQSRAKKAKSR